MEDRYDYVPALLHEKSKAKHTRHLQARIDNLFSGEVWSAVQSDSERYVMFVPGDWQSKISIIYVPNFGL